MYRLGLIGYPIGHSLSPWIHQKFLEKSGVAGDYRLFEITPEDDFTEKIQQLQADKVHGFNVTVPYKQKIIPYLDGLDATAEAMQAVNTVRFEDGKWLGYSTDGPGYLRSLENAYPDFFQDLNKKVLIIGAGGAARAIYYELHQRGLTQIDIANRTREKAEEIAALGGSTVDSSVYTLEVVNDRLDTYDLLIQTTSVGMKSIDAEPIITIDQLKQDAIVSDIIYQPIKTELLKAAEAEGARILLGHTMLLYQAQASFEIWTGKQLDVAEMSDELLQVLKGW